MSSESKKTDSERLASIEAKLDMLIESKKDQETRLRSLERRDAYVAGGSAALSFISPMILKKFFGL
jgi:ribosomal 50S subunit-associated protein YjgA (DUF615 family)